MKAIEEVRAKFEDSGLDGRVEKTYHKLHTGYWWFPDQGESVYLGRSKEVALVAIDAIRYSGKRGARWNFLTQNGFTSSECG